MRLKLVTSLIVLVAIVNGQDPPTEEAVRQLLAQYDEELLDYCNPSSKASWAVQTFVGNATLVEELNAISVAYAQFRMDKFNEHWKDLDPNSYTDPLIKRQLTFLKDLGSSILNEVELTNFNSIVNRMSTVYNTAVVCPYTNKDCDKESDDDVLTLDPHIEQMMAEKTNYDELEYIWNEWHENFGGNKIRTDYKEYVELMNKIAQENNYEDASKMWQARYEHQGTDTFEEWIDKLWVEVAPLYEELHRYVRFKLLEIHGNKMNASDPLIPAHLLGNMWAQSWVNLYDRIKPFKNGSLIDVTAKLKEKPYTVKEMFELSNDFYMSMGLGDNSMSYGEKAIIEKPEDRTITCHASAWDFCDNEDFRIKMCTSVNMEDFITIHHEMGHIQYYIQYKEQPRVLRGGANPGFHEAVGDTIALSVASTTHLKEIGLLDDYEDSEENDINALFHMALERVAFLPFGLLIDKWRWQVFNGAIDENNWNQEWWNLRQEYQKIRAPSPRAEEYFDPGAKYHVPANSQYIAYFVAHLLEFQLYRSLCIEAGQYDPNNEQSQALHKCDFYRSTNAGAKLAAGLKMGTSEHWSAALSEITGEVDITGAALNEYFTPLLKYLKDENEKLEIENTKREQLQIYDEEASIMTRDLVEAEWNVATDTNNVDKQAELLAQTKRMAEFTSNEYASKFSQWQESDFTDESLRRQLMFLSDIGVAALDEAKLESLTTIKTRMENVYSTGKVCPRNNTNCDLTSNGLSLDPDLYDLFAKSRDYDELEYYWTAWHDTVGIPIKDDYERYVELTNEAARINNYLDTGAQWRAGYEDEKFEENMEALWNKVEPLYDALHKYVKRKLKTQYGDKIDNEDELIPAHVLGNMWAQSWVNIYDITKPFANGTELDVTEALQAKFESIREMFVESDRFYKDMGLEPMEMSYDESKAMIEKPDREVTCHASAWDFYDGEDFRIKMCTSKNMEDFVTIHHEMGHIQYFILYKDQPYVFKTGANPGFHEAVGDTIALSVSSTTHLKKVGLLPANFEENYVNNINSLFKMALERIAFLPFGYLIDMFRWKVFAGDFEKDEWNNQWWELREKYQKIKSPVERKTENFDAGAKFHVPADSEYINYFFAHILEFQLLQAVCIAADQFNPADPTEKPLHLCDIDNSKEAGQLLRDGLSLGMSQHWSVALERMTGSKTLDAEPLLNYFNPLMEFLKQENDNEETPEEVSNKIPIIIGSVIGALLLVAIVGYIIYYFKRRPPT